jgi:flavin-dependent dehydrogenase
MAGLTAARTLADRGAAATVLEASPRIGGRVRDVRLGDTESITDYTGRKLGPVFIEWVLRANFEWNVFCSLEEMSRVLLLQSGRLFLGARPKQLSIGLKRLPAALAAGLELFQGRQVEVLELRESGAGSRSGAARAAT